MRWIANVVMTLSVIEGTMFVEDDLAKTREDFQVEHTEELLLHQSETRIMIDVEDCCDSGCNCITYFEKKTDTIVGYDPFDREQTNDENVALDYSRNWGLKVIKSVCFRPGLQLFSSTMSLLIHRIMQCKSIVYFLSINI